MSEKYKKIQDTMNLPQLASLTEKFDIELNADDELLEQLRIEMSDKLFTFSERILEPIMAGSDSYSSLFEQDMLSKKERQEIFRLYKKIQALKWENNMLSISKDDKMTAEWIKKTWELWNTELEFYLSTICKKLADSWTNMNFPKEKTNYHG